MLDEVVDAVGPYRVTGVLGWGATGAVYRGADANGSSVAIKVRRAGLDAAWRAEVATLARLAKRGVPGIVKILDVGAEPELWYAMDLVGTESLRDALRRVWQPLGDVPCDLTAPVEATEVHARTTGLRQTPRALAPLAGDPEGAGSIGQLLGCMGSIATTLSHLHAAGVTHGDLKPDNIVLGGGREPVLIDFGSASFGMAEDLREAPLIANKPWMTPGYIAPEISKGEPPTPRSDLYALGCILFEILTGGLPRQTSTPHLNWLDSSSAVKVGALKGLIDGLLQPDPGERLHFAADVAEAIAALPGCGSAARGATPLPRPLHRPRYVGQAPALQSIADAIVGLPDQPGGLFIIEGEGGSGKTRLLAEVLRSQRTTDVQVIVARRGAHASIASSSLLGGLLDALRAAVKNRPAPAFVDAVLGGGRLKPAEGVPPPRPAELRRAVLWLAETRPLLLIVDDLDEADDLTRSLLHELNGPPAARGVLALATFHSDREDHATRELASRAGRHLALTRLLEGDLPVLLRDGMATLQLPAGLARLVYERSAGNPRYALELARWAIDTGFLKRSGSRWVRDEQRPGADGELPANLEQLLERRCHQLSTCALSALQMLTVLGGEQDVDQVTRLCQVAFALDVPRAEAACDELLQKGLVRLLAGSRYELDHPLLKGYVYSQLAVSERQRLHRHAACTLAEAIQRTGDGESGDQLGAHWLDAGEPERALEHLIVAGRLHAEQRRLRRAERALSRALVCIDAISKEEPARVSALRSSLAGVCESLVDVRSQLGWVDEAIGTLHLLLECAEDPVVSARALRRWGSLHMARYEHASAEEKYSSAVERLESVTPHSAEHLHEHNAVQLCRVENAYFQRDVPRMRALLADLQPALSRGGDAVQSGMFALYRANLLFQEAGFRYTPAAGAEWLKAIEGLEQGALTQESLALARVDLGTALLFGGAGEWALAFHHLSEGIRTADRLSDMKLLARGYAYSATALRRLRRVAEVEKEARWSVDLAESCQIATYVAVGWGNLAWAAVMRGEPAKATALAERALAIWRDGEHCYPLQWIALFPWLAAGESRDPKDFTSPLALLLDAGQQPLPDDLVVLLRGALNATDGERADQLQQALLAAARLGYV